MTRRGARRARRRVLLDPNAMSTDGSLAFAGARRRATTARGSPTASRTAAATGRPGTCATSPPRKDLPGPARAHQVLHAGVHPRRHGHLLQPVPGAAARQGADRDRSRLQGLLPPHRHAGRPATSWCYERPDHPTWQFELTVTRDGRYLVITIGDGQVGDRGVGADRYLDLSAPGGPAPVAADRQLRRGVRVRSATTATSFYFKTTLGRANKRIIAIDTRAPAPQRAGATVVARGRRTRSSGATLVGHQIFVTTMKDAHHAVTAYDLRGKKLRDVELPGLGSAFGLRRRPRRQGDVLLLHELHRARRDLPLRSRDRQEHAVEGADGAVRRRRRSRPRRCSSRARTAPRSRCSSRRRRASRSTAPTRR